MSYEPIQTQTQEISSNERPTIPDLTVEPLENMEYQDKPTRFGKIVNNDYTTPDPEFDTDQRVITAQPTRVDADLSRKLTKSTKSVKKTRKYRRYHYVKQGKKCKKVMNQYKKLKCRGKRSKKCRPLQRKRK